MTPCYDRLYAKIDLDAIRYNLKNIKDTLKPGTGVLAVIKADAYGHGACEIARAINDEIAMAGVAGVSEALELRKVFAKPILVLGYTHESQFERAVENSITLTVFDAENCGRLSETALKIGKTALVNIAVDTGMRRIGVMPSDSGLEEVRKIAALPRIKITGIFSHFAKADESAETETAKQKALFDGFCERLRADGIDFGTAHITNSAGIMRRLSDYGIVRAGIILYGCYPSGEMNKSLLSIRPAMSLITRIVSIRTLARGEGVSYGHTFVADKDMKIATLSAGYADGVPRLLSNRGEVIIRGLRCPIVGRVCMDQFMVDVSALGCNANVGDEAIIFGDGLPVEEVAEKGGSFNYELLCRITRRVPRIYYEGGKPVKIVEYNI